jgi:hypothetical protein
MRPKKTCNGCKALEEGQGRPSSCALGLADEETTKFSDGSSLTTPVPPKAGCPKPKTLVKLVELLKTHKFLR